MDQDQVEEILGITRCAQCGHRLNGEIECPVCSGYYDAPARDMVPKWIYITACFMTSPLSLYALIKTDRLNRMEKAICFSGCLVWLGLYRFWF
ncbi:MAG: hypothetical protein ISR96_01220 [Nitrospira sp.]|nr:hypothetical protein [bacterium]MBL7048134.1 hypothetical protein [Nitrospira sp.]